MELNPRYVKLNSMQWKGSLKFERPQKPSIDEMPTRSTNLPEPPVETDKKLTPEQTRAITLSEHIKRLEVNTQIKTISITPRDVDSAASVEDNDDAVDAKEELTGDSVKEFYEDYNSINGKMAYLLDILSRLRTEGEKRAIIKEFLSSNGINSVTEDELFNAVEGQSNGEPVERDFWTLTSLVDQIKAEYQTTKLNEFVQKYRLDADTAKQVTELMQNGGSITELGEILGFTGIKALFAFLSD